MSVILSPHLPDPTSQNQKRRIYTTPSSRSPATFSQPTHHEHVQKWRFWLICTRSPNSLGNNFGYSEMVVAGTLKKVPATTISLKSDLIRSESDQI